MIGVTGSALERVVQCPASAVLPQAPSTGEDAIKGTSNHEAVEQALATGDIDLVPVSAQKMVASLVEGRAVSLIEPAFAIDIVEETVRLIGQRIGRNYGVLGPNEIALSSDVILDIEGEPVVVDWKSRSRVTPAARNMQLKAECFAALALSRKQKVTGVIAYLDDGETDEMTFDVFDAQRFMSDMRAMVAKIQKAREQSVPAVSAGPWCSYCPAMPSCPAHAKSALVLLGEMEAIEQRIQEMTIEQVGQAYEKLKLIDKFKDRVDKAVRLRIEAERVPLSNGKMLGLVEAKRESFDKDKALARMKEAGLDTTGLTKTTRYSTIKELKNA